MSEPKLSDTPNDWISPEHELPPDGEVVHAMNSSGQVTKLKRQGRLWFVPDGSMYVYYEPRFWQLILLGSREEKGTGER